MTPEKIMADLKLEVGEDQTASTCSCCGARSWTGHGFVYKGDDPFAVYYVGATEAHRDDGVTMAVAVGEWSEDSGPDDRVCLGLEVREDGARINFHFISSHESPWGKTDLLGEMVSRESALAHQAMRDVLDVAELVVSQHPAVRSFLHADDRPRS
jgi:hypothetical protein